MTSDIARDIERAVSALDLERLRRTYWEQDEFIHLEHWLPGSIVTRMVAEVQRVRPQIHRNYIPRHKKGGSVSYYTLLTLPPFLWRGM